MPKIGQFRTWWNWRNSNSLTFLTHFWAFAMHAARDHNLCHASKSWKKEEKQFEAQKELFENRSRNATYAFEFDDWKSSKHRGGWLQRLLLYCTHAQRPKPWLKTLWWRTLVFVIVLILRRRRPTTKHTAQCSAWQWAVGSWRPSFHAFSSHIYKTFENISLTWFQPFPTI